MLARPTILTAVEGLTASAGAGGFAPPLVVLVVTFCLLFVLLALLIAYAKRDVSIDLTMLEIRR
jgi:hypothetical protein